MNKKWIAILSVIIIYTAVPLYNLIFKNNIYLGHWSRTNTNSAGLAPSPKELKNTAIIQIYAARVFGLKGLFAEHCWIAIKNKKDSDYTVVQIKAWKKNVVEIKHDIPDRYWFGAKPRIIFQVKGQKAENIIPEIITAAKTYPYQKLYRLWPGPNSNTFIAYLIRNSSMKNVILPITAIGKDYSINNNLFTEAISKTGFQFSFRALIGITVAKKEGLEIIFLGLTTRINKEKPYIHLPGYRSDN